MDRKKAMLAVLALVALGLGVRSLWPWLMRFDAAGGVSALGRRSTDAKAAAPTLTPLRLADLELKAAEYHPGRDPFRFEAAPPPPPPPAPAPVQEVQPAPQAQPRPRPGAGRPPAPKPPPVDVTYLGSFGPDSGKIAVFGDGTDIYNVRRGDILKTHFVVDSINYESADLKYVDFPQLPATRLAAGQ